jgi:hypothetical protein
MDIPTTVNPFSDGGEGRQMVGQKQLLYLFTSKTTSHHPLCRLNPIVTEVRLDLREMARL